MMHLTRDQKYQVLEIARQQGEECERCGSSELVISDLPVKVFLSGRMIAALYCENGCGHWYPVKVVVKENGVGQMVPA